jgi:ferredoxin
MFLYPGGNDTNKYCILCSECLKSCPNNTMRLGLRPPLKDLWANKSFTWDESFNIIALLGVSTIAPIMLIKNTESLTSRIEKATHWSGRYPDIVAKTLLYVSGLLLAFLLVITFAVIVNRLASPEEGFKGWKHYANVYASPLVPLPLMKLIADISDHIVRNGSSVIYVVYNFIVDFPYGREDAPGSKKVSSPLALDNTTIIFGLQVFFLTIGFLGSAWAIWKTVVNWEPQRKFSTAEEAKIAGIMMLTFSILITLFNIWAVSGPALL